MQLIATTRCLAHVSVCSPFVRDTGTLFALLVTLILSGPATAEDAPSPLTAAQETAVNDVVARTSQLNAANKAIWEFAEVGLQEHQSSALLIDALRNNGFDVETGVSNMPTAFVASYGSGTPIIAILAEYDALPNLSQKVLPYREPATEGAGGHGCGHNSLGVGALGAALATKAAMEKHQIPGTIRLYGTPAEETLIGKIYMLLDGQFDDVDFCLHWHPSSKNAVFSERSKAAVSAKFTFSGTAAHASGAPHQGRSALDAVELMNIGANYMREHITEDARIHYVVTNGGDQPNVVPREATVWYYVRADNHDTVERNFKWIQEIAAGAALMSQTEMACHIDTDCHEMIPNPTLGDAIHANMLRIGPPKFDQAEHEFAARLQQSVTEEFGQTFKTTLNEEVAKRTGGATKGSTDVGDVSWHVPTNGLNATCMGDGLPGHSWQQVASSGSTISEKGTLFAAKVLAVTAIQLLQDETLRNDVTADFKKRMADRKYTSLIPEGQLAPATIR